MEVARHYVYFNSVRLTAGLGIVSPFLLTLISCRQRRHKARV
jgi:hypothetical protein